MSTLLLGTTIAMAQNNKPLNLTFEARGDYRQTSVDGEKLKEESGFKGNVANLILKGDLSPKFSYGIRHRLNKIKKDASFFDATDWLYLRYKANDHFSFTAGKFIVLVSGWELEPAPIDCYFLSDFCYNFPCYQWGGIVEYTPNQGKDRISFQLCRSPYESTYEGMTGNKEDMYGYNLSWTGRHGFFEPLWSINMSEYAPGKYINYIALGNRFYVGDNMQVELDFMNRAASGQTFFGKDCSVVGKIAYQPSEKLNLFAKASYEVNHSETEADYAVQNGTEITRVGVGAEYFPLKEKNIRLHSTYSYAFGKNTNPQATVVDKLSSFEVGVTWRVKVL